MTELKTGIEEGQKVVAPAPPGAPKAAEMQQIRHIFPQGWHARMEHCWDKGVDARELGFARVSPYYEDLDADWFWYAGFDGQSFQTALQLYSHPNKEQSNEQVS